nr:SGNH/GDSL hydrolase family protein [Paracoccus saliphilus]
MHGSKILIVGGSNSLRRDGWVSEFSAAYSGKAEIRNLSIGGASTVMGIYRSFFCDSINAGDTVVWEYALNDANFFEIGGCPVDLLLRHVEHLIRRCGQKGARFVPIIMSTLRQESRRSLDQYRAQLHFLFAHYGIEYFDVSFEMRRKLAIPALGREYYDDGNHYTLGGDAVAEVGQRLPGMIENARPIDIKTVRPLFVKPGVQVRLLNQFQNGEVQQFENSVFKAVAHTPGRQPLVVTNNEYGSGTLTGLVVVTTSKGGVIDLQVGDEAFAISLVSDERSFRKPVLKFITLASALGREVELGSGSDVRISWSEAEPPFHADLGCSKSPQEAEIRNREAAVIGLMCELSRT